MNIVKVNSLVIEDKAVQSEHLEDNAVQSNHIKNNAIESKHMSSSLSISALSVSNSTTLSDLVQLGNLLCFGDQYLLGTQIIGDISLSNNVNITGELDLSATIIETFTVEDGQTVNPREIAEFNSQGQIRTFTENTEGLSESEFIQFHGSGISSCHMAALNSSKVISAMDDRIWTHTVDGQIAYTKNSITTGTFNKVIPLNESKAILLYNGSSSGKVCIFNYNGDSGHGACTGEVTFNSNTNHASQNGVALSDNKVIIIYRNNSSPSAIFASILTINGTAITVGPAVSLSYADPSADAIPAIVALENNKVAVIYRTDSTGYLGSSILTISDDSITENSNNILTNYQVDYIHAVPLSNDKILICYTDDSLIGVSVGKTKVASVAENTIIPSSYEEIFCGTTLNDLNYSCLVAISPARAIVAYYDFLNTHSQVKIIKIDENDNVSTGWPLKFETTTDGTNIGLAVIDDHKIMLGYCKGNASYMVGFIYIDKKPMDNIAGIVLEQKSGGEECKVAIGGKVNGFTNLIPGRYCYISEDGSIMQSIYPSIVL